jgi:circadian clock protein KaiC
LRTSAADEIRFHEFIYSIVQRFSQQGVSVMMTSEIPSLFGADHISDSAVSPLADNLVMLAYQRERDAISGRSRSSKPAPAAMTPRFENS